MQRKSIEEKRKVIIEKNATTLKNDYVDYIVKELLKRSDFEAAELAVSIRTNSIGYSVRKYTDPFIADLYTLSLPFVQSRINILRNKKNTDRKKLLDDLTPLNGYLLCLLQKMSEFDVLKRHHYSDLDDNVRIYGEIQSEVAGYVEEINTASDKLNEIDRSLTKVESIYNEWEQKLVGFKVSSERQKQIKTKLDQLRKSYATLNTKYTPKITLPNIQSLATEVSTFLHSDIVQLISDEAEICFNRVSYEKVAKEYFQNITSDPFRFIRGFFYSNIFQSLNNYKDKSTSAIKAEIELLHKIGEAKDTQTVLLTVYQYLKNKKSTTDLDQNLLRTLNYLPETISGIDKPNVNRDLLQDWEIILQQLGKKLGLTHKFLLAGNAVELTLEKEKELLKRWSGILTLIIDNLSNSDVVTPELLINAKREMQRCVQEESYVEFFNLLMNTKNIVTNQPVKNLMIKLIAQMQSLKEPDGKDVQLLVRYFGFQQMLDEIKNKLNALANEYSTWQVKHWAPLTDSAIKIEFNKMLEQYKQLKDVHLKSEDLPNFKDALDNLLEKVNGFPEKNIHFKFLRRFAAVYANIPYAHHPITDLKFRVDTYFDTHILSGKLHIQPKERLPDITFDILKNYFYFEIDGVYQKQRNGYLFTWVDELLRKIKAAGSIQDLLLASYEYLTEQHPGAYGVVDSVERILVGILRQLPIDVTGFKLELDRNSDKSFFVTQLVASLSSSNVSHEIKLGDKKVTWTVNQEALLFARWKNVAVELSKALTRTDLPILNRLFSYDATFIRNSIANTQNITDLFVALEQFKLMCVNKDLNEKVQHALDNISKAEYPDENARYIPATDAFKESLAQLMKIIAHLQEEFSSWNGTLWVQTENGSLDFVMNNLHTSMGLEVQSRIADFAKKAQQFSEKKLTSVTTQNVIDLKDLRSIITTYMSSDAKYLTLHAAKEHKDAEKAQKELLEKAQEEKNQQTIIENQQLAADLVTQIEKIQKNRFLYEEQRHALTRYLTHCNLVKDNNLPTNDAAIITDKYNPDKMRAILEGIEQQLQDISNQAQARRAQLFVNIKPLQDAIIEMKKVTLSSDLTSLFEKIKKEAQASHLVETGEDTLEKMQSLLDEVKFIQLMNDALSNGDVNDEFKKSLLEFLKELNALGNLSLNSDARMELKAIKTKLSPFIKFNCHDVAFVDELANQLRMLALNTFVVCEATLFSKHSEAPQPMVEKEQKQERQAIQL